MTCPDCTKAATRTHGGFRLGCPGCIARGVARGHNFRRCQSTGYQDRQYRDQLREAGVTHADVIAARAADAMTKETV